MGDSLQRSQCQSLSSTKGDRRDIPIGKRPVNYRTASAIKSVRIRHLAIGIPPLLVLSRDVTDLWPAVLSNDQRESPLSIRDQGAAQFSTICRCGPRMINLPTISTEPDGNSRAGVRLPIAATVVSATVITSTIATAVADTTVVAAVRWIAPAII